jgi:hypothetical protein
MLSQNNVKIHRAQLKFTTANPASLPRTVRATVNRECFAIQMPAVNTAAVKKKPCTAPNSSPSTVKPITTQPTIATSWSAPVQNADSQWY